MNLYNYFWAPACWASGMIFVGILGLSGWIVHSRVITTIFPNGVTIAPISAFLFILLGVSMVLSSREKSDNKYTQAKNILLVPAFLMGIWVIIDTISGHPAHIDWNMHPPETIFWMLPESSISPISALLFILLAFGIFGSNKWTQLVFWTALIIIITGGGFLIGYAAGNPLFYGGEIKPVSFLSACGFVLGGIGLLMCIKSDKQNREEG